MSREETYQIHYIVALIAEFAKQFHLNQRQAYNYLKRFKGIDYLMSYIRNPLKMPSMTFLSFVKGMAEH